MAGSMTYRPYVDDAGVTYQMRIDKSNSDGVVSGGNLLTTAPTATYAGIPRGFKKRYALAYNTSNPIMRRKFYIGNPLAIQGAIQAGATISAAAYPTSDDGGGGSVVTWQITYYSGERRPVSFNRNVDTALTDGSSSP